MDPSEDGRVKIMCCDSIAFPVKVKNDYCDYDGQLNGETVGPTFYEIWLTAERKN
jgi:hypothetical protein